MILVEMEPIRYQIENVFFTNEDVKTTRAIQKQIIKLEDGMKSSIAFKWNQTESWGKLPGVLKGVSVQVLGQHVVWGVERVRKVSQEARLECRGGNITTLTVAGVSSQQERRYTGQLVAVYRDGVTARHRVTSTFTHTQLGNLAIIGPGHHLCTLHQAGRDRKSVPDMHMKMETTTTTKPTSISRPFWNIRRYKRRKKTYPIIPIQSTNLLLPARKSVHGKHSTENPLYRFYPRPVIDLNIYISSKCSPTQLNLFLLVILIYPCVM